jgi:N-acetylneuraminic acid mutarotase
MSVNRLLPQISKQNFCSFTFLLGMIMGHPQDNLVWKTGPPLQLPKGGALTGLLNGQLILAGGSYWTNDQKVWIDQVVAFDCAAGYWRSLPSLPRPLANGAGTVWGNGFFCLGGTRPGAVLQDSYCLSFTNNEYRWREFISLPEPLCYARAEVIDDGLCLFGGATDPADLQTSSSTVYRLSLADASPVWKKLAPIPGRGRSLPATAVCNRKVYLFGGSFGTSQKEVVNLRDAYVYDPKLNSWHQIGNPPTATRAWSAAAWNDRYIFLFGGYSTSGAAEITPKGTFSRHVFRYDAQSDRYEEMTALPAGVADIHFHRFQQAFYGAGGEPGVKQRAASTYIGEVR